MEKKYYWLKLKNDFFTDKRIKKLRKIAGGDTYTIIYLKMQLLSLQDGGNLYFDNVENTFEEEIALQIDEDVEDVKITIAFLMSNGLLEQIESDTYGLIETKNCIGKETAGAERVRQFRAREKQKMLQCNDSVTKCNIDIDIELDKDKEKDIYNYIEKNFGRPLSPIEYEQVSKWEDNELTRYAIKQAILNGKYNLKYINAILMNYEKNHILTIQEAQEEEMRFKGKTIINPVWLDKEIQSREATPEEEAEFIKELNEIDNS
jgi:predicted phage replisome organizer